MTPSDWLLSHAAGWTSGARRAGGVPARVDAQHKTRLCLCSSAGLTGPSSSRDVQIYASGGCCEAGPYAGRIDVRLDGAPWKSVQVSGATHLPTYTVLTPGPIELTEKDQERSVMLRNDSIAELELGSPFGYRWVGNGGAGCRFVASPLSLAPGATGAVRVRFSIEFGTAACDVSSKLEFRQVRSDTCGDAPPFAVVDVRGTKGT